MWRWCKNSHDFWMNNEGEMNCWSLMNNWMKHETHSMVWSQHKVSAWQFGNIGLTNWSCAFWAGETKCSHWPKPNGTVNSANSIQIFWVLTLRVYALGFNNSHLVHYHKTNFQQYFQTSWQVAMLFMQTTTQTTDKRNHRNFWKWV